MSFNMFFRNLTLGILIAIANSCFAGEYSITLYTIPARTQIDFSSPRRMAWTALGNTLTMHFSQRKNAMGHVFVELSGPNNSTFVESTKQRLFATGRRELIKGYGLGILFHNMEGRLGFNEMVRDLGSHYHNGDIAFIKALISDENFERLEYYLAEYQRRGYDEIYNGLNRPREGLGAGCTAFGMSFFEIAGILEPEWETAWTVSVKVPHALIGGPITGNFVPLERVFTADAWAEPDEPHEVFDIADPFLIYNWVHKIWRDLLTEGSQLYPGDLPENVKVTPVFRGKAKGLIFDFSQLPAPNEPVFLTPHSEPIISIDNK